MCGRFTLSRSAAEIAEHFGLEGLAAGSDVPTGIEPGIAEATGRYNVAPTQSVVTVREDSEGERLVELRSWGLVPRWADHAEDAARLINARSETAATRPAFRDALRHRRCLIPADGFYEWAGARTRRVPRHVRLPDGELFAMAGLYEAWRGPGGRVLRSCTVLTTRANAAVASLHDRMPVLVDPEGYGAWLSSSDEDGAALLGTIPRARSDLLEVHPASMRVNDVHHEGPDCLAPEPEPQLTLF